MVTRNVKRTYDFLDGLCDRERECCRINIPLPCSAQTVLVYTHRGTPTRHTKYHYTLKSH